MMSFRSAASGRSSNMACERVQPLTEDLLSAQLNKKQIWFVFESSFLTINILFPQTLRKNAQLLEACSVGRK